ALGLGLAEFGVARFVIGVPRLPLLGRQDLRRRELEVDVVHRLPDRHILVVLGQATPGIVVEEGGWLGVLAICVMAVGAQRRQLFAMGLLMLANQQERLRLCAVAQPVYAQLGDDVGGVALVLNLLAVMDHRRVVVDALAGQDVPLVEAGGIADQVPLADDRRL